MLQIVYVSSAAPDAPSDLPGILAASRRNNGRDGVTGLLYADGGRFLQALEGPEDRVEAALTRIRADPRHRALVVLSRCAIDARAFGSWEMAHYRRGADADAFVAQVSRLVRDASPDLRATFEGFARVRHAA